MIEIAQVIVMQICNRCVTSHVDVRRLGINYCGFQVNVRNGIINALAGRDGKNHWSEDDGCQRFVEILPTVARLVEERK